MNKGSGSIRSVSGVGKKGPACFLVDLGGRRFVLDLGEGPPPGLLPDVARIGRVDALILSHGHKDHVGGLSLLPKLGNPPVYATEIVARGLPRTVAVRPLAVGGTADLLGIAVTTGRNGHAPGGIWLHFGIEGGLLYTGDYSTESVLYAYDPPTRPAATALIDCSYADYQKPLAESWRELARFAERGPLLLPVPANGRGPEIALELMRHGIDDIRVDAPMQKMLRQFADGDAIALRPDAVDDIRRLTEIVKPIDGARGVMLAGSADGASGATAQLLSQFENAPEVTILFTGYVNPTTPAERLTKSGRAQIMRWNVHPLLSDTVKLVRAIAAKMVIPAFCDRTKLPALAAALAPARVTMDEIMTF
ncbi:MAG TPA: MBL fold metallo-hydrolase [Xanthobacteraceae bacterium]|nr:MBL fold metallo-hydrolase [Xanthobacteraceae bacterium]